MGQENEKQEMMEKAFRFLGIDRSCSRRDFLRWSGITVVGMTALGALRAKAGETPLIIMDRRKAL
jgi:hypothetical protein